MSSKTHTKAKLYTKYPISSLLIYQGSTLLHFLLGGFGLILGYNYLSWLGYTLGGLYVVFAFVVMYAIMPLRVCPKCVYYELKDSRCISGLNLFSRRIAKAGNQQTFNQRGKGLFCPNNLYMAALILPILVMIPALIANFSMTLLVVFIVLLGLLLFRFFIIFPKIACLHCRAKFKCPQAGAMGVRNL